MSSQHVNKRPSLSTSTPKSSGGHQAGASAMPRPAAAATLERKRPLLDSILRPAASHDVPARKSAGESRAAPSGPNKRRYDDDDGNDETSTASGQGNKNAQVALDGDDQASHSRQPSTRERQGQGAREQDAQQDAEDVTLHVAFPSVGTKFPVALRHSALLKFVQELRRIHQSPRSAMARRAMYDEATALEQSIYLSVATKNSYANKCGLSLRALKNRPAGDVHDQFSRSNDKYAIESNIEKYLLTREQLVQNGYLVSPLPSDPSTAPEAAGEGESVDGMVCARCGDRISDKQEEPPRETKCQFHPGKVWTRRKGYWVPGQMEVHSCCEAIAGSPGCKVTNYHVPANRPLRYANCADTAVDSSFRGTGVTVYAIDCEMVLTAGGTELARVTVIDRDGKIALDEYVVPQHEILDYNTGFSGITAESLVGVSTYLVDVQLKLLSMMNARTVLLGHSLESDLRALKMVHERVVDTSVVFPHPKGPPLKRPLRGLATDILGKTIQFGAIEGVGHDSAEDARTCIELMKWKIKHDIDNGGATTKIAVGASE